MKKRLLAAILSAGLLLGPAVAQAQNVSQNRVARSGHHRRGRAGRRIGTGALGGAGFGALVGGGRGALVGGAAGAGAGALYHRHRRNRIR
jgi:osmotically inducible lipoprotein OsmB